MNEITTKEIRGITLKNVVAMVCIIIPLIVGGAIGYSNIMYAIKDSQKSNVVIQLQIDALKADIKNTQNDQRTLDIRLTRVEENIKDKIFIKDAP